MLKVACLLIALAFVSGPGAAQSLASTTLPAAPPQADAASDVGCSAPEDRMTSGDFLPHVAECLLGPQSREPDPRRVALVQDIGIKAWSYSLLNKVAFWVAVGLGLCLLLWPSFVAIQSGRASSRRKTDDDTPEHWSQRATTTSAIQTSIAALAALSFAFYAHYKGNQVKAENLMREIVFAEDMAPERMTAILQAISEMDKGFGFTTVEALKGK